MRFISKYFFPVVSLSCVFVAARAPASSKSTETGDIHFSGAVVEAGCSTITSRQSVSMTCYRDGKSTTTMIANKQSLTGDKPFNSTLSLEKFSMNPEKTVELMIVRYD